MKFKLIACLLLSIPALSTAMNKTYKMPSAQVLEKRLKAEDFSKFMEQTKIVEEIANKELFPLQVCYLAQNNLITYFINRLTNSMPYKDVNALAYNAMKQLRPRLFKLLLRDYTYVIDSLGKIKFKTR